MLAKLYHYNKGYELMYIMFIIHFVSNVIFHDHFYILRLHEGHSGSVVYVFTKPKNHLCALGLLRALELQSSEGPSSPQVYHCVLLWPSLLNLARRYDDISATKMDLLCPQHKKERSYLDKVELVTVED